MRLILGLSLFVVNSTCWSDGLPNFFESNQSVDILASVDENLMIETQEYFFDEKRERYIGEDQPMQEDSLLNHNFYQDNGVRIYNNTQYSFDDIKNKYAQASQVTFEDLSISLGYGMEFDLNHQQSVGYEYISSFPHDRGQSVRIFWKVKF